MSHPDEGQLGIEDLDPGGSSWTRSEVRGVTTVEVERIGGTSSGTPGVTDHGLLTGLADNDHPQYALGSALTAHTGNTLNPHSVTKTQVGLGNVSNTAPADLPISTATQSALDGKASTAHALSHGDGGSDEITVSVDQINATPSGDVGFLREDGTWAPAGVPTESPWKGAWTTSTAYAGGDAVNNDNALYLCTVGHTSGAGNEPGTGASWETVWLLLLTTGTGTVQSVAGVEPVATDVPRADLVSELQGGTGADLAPGNIGPGDIGAATSTQGAKADTAVQPAAIADFISGDGITAVVALTQSEYDLLTPDSETLYVITD